MRENHKQEIPTCMRRATSTHVRQAGISIGRPVSTTDTSEPVLCEQECAVSKHIVSSLCTNMSHKGTVHFRELWSHAPSGLGDGNTACHTPYIYTLIWLHGLPCAGSKRICVKIAFHTCHTHTYFLDVHS